MSVRFHNIWGLLALVIVIPALACTASSVANTTPETANEKTPSSTPETIPVITIPAMDTTTPEPTEEPPDTNQETEATEETEEPEPTPDLPTAKVTVLSINLRTGPSSLFSIYGVYPEDSYVAVLGKSVGEEWVQVQAADGKKGWLSVQYIEMSTPLADIPEVDVPDSWLVSGRVIDSEDVPVEAINLAIYPLDDSSTRTDVHTNDQGMFYAYIPSNQRANWVVDIVGLGCDSHIMDDDCQLTGYVGPPPIQTIDLPLTAPIEFVYEKATATISGMVFDTNGKPAVNVRVVAKRPDGMQVFGNSNEYAAFTLPVIDGTWVVYAVRFDPRQEGDKISVTVSNVSVEGVTIVAP